MEGRWFYSVSVVHVTYFMKHPYVIHVKINVALWTATSGHGGRMIDPRQGGRRSEQAGW